MTAAAVLADAVTDSGRITGGWTVAQDPAFEPATDEGPLSVYRRQATLDDGSRADHWFLVNVSASGLPSACTLTCIPICLPLAVRALVGQRIHLAE